MQIWESSSSGKCNKLVAADLPIFPSHLSDATAPTVVCCGSRLLVRSFRASLFGGKPNTLGGRKL